MYINEIKDILINQLNLKEVYVSVSDNHYKIIVIDEIFLGKSKLDQHKIVYAPISEYIIKEKIHSVSIHTFCPTE